MDKPSPGCILGFALFAVTALAAVFGVAYAGCLAVAWITGWPTFHSFIAVLGCASFALGFWLLTSILRSVEGIAGDVEDLGIHLSGIDEVLHEHLKAGVAEEVDDGDDNPSGKPLKVVR